MLGRSLGDADPMKAFNARWRLAAAGDQAVAFIHSSIVDPAWKETMRIHALVGADAGCVAG